MALRVRLLKPAQRDLERVRAHLQGANVANRVLNGQPLTEPGSEDVIIEHPLDFLLGLTAGFVAHSARKLVKQRMRGKAKARAQKEKPK